MEIFKLAWQVAAGLTVILVLVDVFFYGARDKRMAVGIPLIALWALISFFAWCAAKVFL